MAPSLGRDHGARPDDGARDGRGRPYVERPALLPGAMLWTRTVPSTNATAAGAHAPTRVLPDGCLDLILGPDGLIVAGPDTQAQVMAPRPGATWVGIRCPPGVGPVVLGAPASEVRDRRLPLADLWGAAVAGRLERRLRDASSGDAADLLDHLARLRFAAAVRGDERRTAIRPDPALGHLVSLLRAGTPVGSAADAVGIGVRQLHRRSLVAFGYGPKTLARILRLTRALDLARAGTPAATVAAETGYADQPHLSREVRALAGVSLGDLLGPEPTRQASGA